MAFTQQITVQGADAKALVDHISGWHSKQAGTAPGYRGARLFAERGSDRHVVEVDFDSEEEARRNDDRPETAEWAEKLRNLGSATYRDLDQVHSTYAGG